MFDTILIQGKPALKGNPELQKEKLFGLEPGDKINIIGRKNKNNKITSSCRIDEYTMPLTYCGTFNKDNQKWMAFLVPSDGVTGFNLFNPVEPIYILYAVEENELVQYNYHKQIFRIFKPHFSLTL